MTTQVVLNAFQWFAAGMATRILIDLLWSYRAVYNSIPPSPIQDTKELVVMTPDREIESIKTWWQINKTDILLCASYFLTSFILMKVKYLIG